MTSRHIVVIGGAAVFALICFAKSWADIPLSLAETNLKSNHFAEALNYSQIAKIKDPWNPAADDLMGRAAYFLALKDHNPEKLGFAEKALSALVKKVPYHSKGWLYLALTRALEAEANGGMNAVRWTPIQAMLEKAHESEPGSSWMAFMVGKALLSYDAFLSETEKSRALDLIRKSLAMHHPNQPSLYLNAAIEFLWAKFADFRLLKIVTPADVFSYARLVQFVEKKNLWMYRNEINPYYLQLNEAFYENQCEKGFRFIEKRNYRKAEAYFDRAFGVNNVKVKARAGRIITKPMQRENEKAVISDLAKVLESGEKGLNKYMPFLGGVIQRTYDLYLNGLYAYDRGDYKSAADAFSLLLPATENWRVRAYLADSYWRLGKKEKALAMTKSILEQKDPDLRALYILKGWNSELNNAVEKKISEIATDLKMAGSWQGKGSDKPGYLDRKGRQHVYVNLKPGRVSFLIQMKGTADSQNVYPYATLHLWDGQKIYHFDSAYVPNKEFKAIKFSLETTGGSRDVEIELVNGALAGSGEKGPVLELGDLKIEYADESR